MNKNEDKTNLPQKTAAGRKRPVAATCAFCVMFLYYVVFPSIVAYTYVPKFYRDIHNWLFAMPCAGQEYTDEVIRNIDIDEVYKEVDTHFIFKGRPIDPELINEFNNYVSDDRLPITVSVDIISGYSTNEYYANHKVDQYGNVVKDNRPFDDVIYAGFIGYKWLGRLENGLHVVKFFENGGGSGTFYKLMLIRIEKSKGLDGHQNEYDRLLASIVFETSLGDRFEGDIFVYDYYVVLGKSYRLDLGLTLYNEKPIILVDFRK